MTNNLKALSIHFLSGNRINESIDYSGIDKISIGRDRNSDIVFDTEQNPTISRQHAFIEKIDNQWFLIDISTNGSIVNGNKVKKDKVRLNNKDQLAFSKKGELIEIIISEKEIIEPLKTEYGKNVASFTKIIPVSREGFFKELRTQSFFLPALTTVLFGLLLFPIFGAARSTGERIWFYLYELLLGSYLGMMIIFFVRSVGNIKTPLWLPILAAISTGILLIIQVPFSLLSVLFRPEIIVRYMEHPNNFIEYFIGHFVGAGLLEEIFKSIPVWGAFLFANRFSRLNFSGFKNGHIVPTTAVMIGASSAVGFIIIETLIQYVPQVQSSTEDPIGVAWGLMLLFPRFITGISGHVAWSGIFAYFIALGFYYKQGKFTYPLLGLLLSSTLHGLWNSTAAFNYLISVSIALFSFIGFTVYLYKASKTFSENN